MLLRFLRQLVCITTVVVAASGQSIALQPGTALNRLGRQSWTIENGLPQNSITVLMQSRSGYLWAGTELGLARFDGVSFRVFDHANEAAFPEGEVRCILDEASKRSGESLWIGTSDGLVHLVDGRPVLLTTRDGLPSNSIRGMAESTDGTIWVWTEGGLARWDGRQIHPVPDAGGQHGSITSIAADNDNGFWEATSQGVFIHRDGSWRPVAQDHLSGSGHTGLVTALGDGDILISNGESVLLSQHGRLTPILNKAELPEGEIAFMAKLTSGSIAVASKSMLVLKQTDKAGSTSRFRLSASSAVGHREEGRDADESMLPGSQIETVYADREDSLWIGTNRGIARITKQSGTVTLQALPSADALSSTSVMAFFEDREGDLWVGTETAGLHILRDTRIRVFGTGDGLTSDVTTAVVPAIQQKAQIPSIWVGTRDSGLNQLTLNAEGAINTAAFNTSNGLLSNVILALAAAPDGDIWVGTPDGLNRIHGKSVASFTSADGLPDDFIRSLLVAPDDSLWIGTRHGLTHFDHGRFKTLTQQDGLGSGLVGALARSADGDLWIATLNGLSRLHEGRLHNYTTTDGLSSNVITALEVTPEGQLWIGTQSDGLNLWDGIGIRAVEPIRNQNHALPLAIHGIQSDGLGHLWLASDNGITRADVSALVACAEHAPCRPNAIHFTTADGLRSRDTSSNSHPTTARTSDGRLWFTTPRGIVALDPKHFAAVPETIPVVIERFEIDDHADEEMLGTSYGLPRIPAGHIRFRFDYAGLNFATPQKLRYQYMLQGFDHTWTDAGTRRTAYYTNIPAGNYTFHVRATLGDEPPPTESSTAKDAASYTPSEASLSFELLPHYYQTIWFQTLVVLTVAVLLLWIFRRRVLRVRRELTAVMAERNRIAREIHDTLAQGYVGISLQLEILGELLRHNRTETAQKHLAATQRLVREGLEDARKSIWALRSQDSGEQALPIRLRRLVEEAQNDQLAATFEVHGASRPLPADVERETLRIAQEAIQNVKRHAGASQLVVRLDYDEREVALTISDNGRGFTASKSPVPGHYGLIGMQERAALIHGRIEVESQPDVGTTVKLSFIDIQAESDAPMPQAAVASSVNSKEPL